MTAASPLPALPADLLYGRLLATAAAHVDGIAPPAARRGLEHTGLPAAGGRWIAVLRRP